MAALAASPANIADAYDKIAFSDADGNEADPNRYVAPVPNVHWESTHIVELTIANTGSAGASLLTGRVATSDARLAAAGPPG